MDSWDILSYLLFFIYGYLLFPNTRIQDTIGKYSPLASIGAALLTLAILALDGSNALYWWALRALCAWCWIIAFLGYGSRFLNVSNRFLGYATEAVLPFYYITSNNYRPYRFLRRTVESGHSTKISDNKHNLVCGHNGHL